MIVYVNTKKTMISNINLKLDKRDLYLGLCEYTKKDLIRLTKDCIKFYKKDNPRTPYNYLSIIFNGTHFSTIVSTPKDITEAFCYLQAIAKKNKWSWDFAYSGVGSSIYLK